MSHATGLTVAQAFVKQYYDMMATNPSELYRFYTEASQFCHTEDPSGVAEYFSGLNAIRERIDKANLLECVVDLSDGAYDVQVHDVGSSVSILVIVTGHFSKKDTSPTPFAHTFILAKPDAAAHYYVHNSVFRLQSYPVSASSANDSAARVNVCKEVIVEVTSAPAPDVVSKTEEKITVPDVAEVEAEPISSPLAKSVDEKNAPVAAPVSAVKEVVKEDKDHSQKKPLSFAELAKKNSSGAASMVFPPAQPRAPKNAFKNTTEKVVKEEKKVNLDKAQLDNMKNSMYIKQVTTDVKEAALRELFGNFGAITRCDVQSNKGFAFIDFAKRESLLEALNSKDPLVCCGVTLRVEERTPKPRDKELNGQSTGAAYAAKNNGRNNNNSDNKKSSGDSSSSGKKKNGDNNGTKKKAGGSGDNKAASTGEKGWSEKVKK